MGNHGIAVTTRAGKTNHFAKILRFQLVLTLLLGRADHLPGRYFLIEVRFSGKYGTQ
jgi:hypothetical protein